MPNLWRKFIGWWAALAGATVLAAPAPHRVTLTDYLGTDWSRELIHEPLRLEAGELRLPVARVTRADGQEVPSQVSDVVRYDDGSIETMKVWFFADLPAHGTSVYTILPGAEPAATTGVFIHRDGDSLTLTTAAPNPLGIRLLGGERTLPWPQPLDDALSPIQGLLMPSGRQVGKGRFAVPFRLHSYESVVTATGPLFADVEIRYRFDVGYWTVRTRVLDGCPMIQLEEEFNTGHSGQWAKQFDRFFEFRLNEGGFQPTQGWYGANSWMPRWFDLGKGLVPRSWEATTALPASRNYVATPVTGYTLSFAEERDDFYLQDWPSVTPQIGSFIRFVEPGGEAIGFGSLHIMEWRDAQSIRFRTNPQGELLVRLPVQKYNQDWAIDGFADGSPNYTGVTWQVPPGTCRRSYGIMLSAAEDEREQRLESLSGMIAHLSAQPLDEVRHWVLDWPDPLAGAAWATEPTAAGTRAVETMRNRMKLARLAGNLATFSMANHFTYSKGVFPELEKTVNDPSLLTAEQRRELRPLLAFEAYRQNSFELFPYGTGVHLNNPNMTIMACEARAKSALLVKDHPQYRAWGEVTLELMKDYFVRFTFPSGVPFENPSYTLGVTLDWAAIANRVLVDAGIGDALDTELMRRTMDFVTNWLTPPDPRFLGHRMVMPIGNSSNQSVPPSFGESYAAYYRDRDPKLAGELQWFTNQTLSDEKKIQVVEERQPELRSRWFGDYGVIFRHGFGTPYETFLHMLAGKNKGHYENETDQLAYTIHAKGQPIHLHFANGYFPMLCRPWLRNRISFNMKVEAPERGRIAVEQATFSPAADYVHAIRETDQLLPSPSEFPKLDPTGIRWSDEEAQDFADMMAHWDQPEVKIPLTVWHRQIVFVKDPDPKGPNYFVVRDGFGGVPTQPTDLSLWFLATRMTEQAGVYHFDGQCEADMDVFVHTPAPGTFTPQTGTYGHSQHPSGRHTGFDPKYFPDGKLREDQLLLRLRQPPGSSYLVVLYPRLKEIDEPATYRRLANSVVEVTTPLSTDTIFVDFTPVTYADSRVKLSGLAGAVRHYRSGKIAVINSDGACEIAVAGKTVAGHGAFAVELDDTQARITWRDEGAEATIR